MLRCLQMGKAMRWQLAKAEAEGVREGDVRVSKVMAAMMALAVIARAARGVEAAAKTAVAMAVWTMSVVAKTVAAMAVAVMAVVVETTLARAAFVGTA